MFYSLSFILILLFADATTVLIEAESTTTAIHIMYQELLVDLKTRYMPFHKTGIKHDIYLPLYLDNKQIDIVNFTKFLSIIIDGNLYWSNHIYYIENKIPKGLELINRARIFFTMKTLLRLYNTFIFSYLNYDVEIWGNAQD